ncbi:MAG: biopolymer transporter ExbD [Verrucomicrobiaceae bacterium]|nr:biopolymer transporter ExbD [Verrucomicrobiaceae bacterium]
MKRLSNRRQLRLISEVSITPLMDLVLILLLVFVIAAPLLKKDKALALPPASPAPEAPKSVVRLFVFKDQSVTLDGAMLARVDLPSALKQLVAQRPGAGVEVRAHRELNVQHLLEVMEMVKEAGVTRTAVSSHADEP